MVEFMTKRKIKKFLRIQNCKHVFRRTAWHLGNFVEWKCTKCGILAHQKVG